MPNDVNRWGEVEKILSELGIPKEYSGTSGIDEYVPGTITFLSKPKLLDFVKPNLGAAILVNKSIYDQVKDIPGNKYILVDHPPKVFMMLHNLLNKGRESLSVDFDKGLIHQTAVIGKNVKLGKRVRIMPNCVIGSNIRIGDDTVLRPGAIIYDNVEIGSNCLIGPQSVIGEDGFRNMKDENGNMQHLIHTGKVIIGNHVHIGGQSNVNRGTFKDTVIGDHVKIDNHVHIGHNDVIGKNCIICAATCIGGSTTIGEEAWIGIGVTIANALTIGKGAFIGINAVVVRNVPDGEEVSGFYAKSKLAWEMKEIEEMRKFRKYSSRGGIHKPKYV